jgi:hypothetical protein
MNARKVLSVLGIIVVVLVAAIVAISLFTFKKMESEANAKKTEAARRARWSKNPEAKENALSEPLSPAEQLTEADLQDDINGALLKFRIDDSEVQKQA